MHYLAEMSGHCQGAPLRPCGDTPADSCGVYALWAGRGTRSAWFPDERRRSSTGACCSLHAARRDSVYAFGDSASHGHSFDSFRVPLIPPGVVAPHEPGFFDETPAIDAGHVDEHRDPVDHTATGIKRTFGECLRRAGAEQLRTSEHAMAEWRSCSAWSSGHGA